MLRDGPFFKQDVREIAQVQELATVETFATLLTGRSGQQLVCLNPAPEGGGALDTAKRWVDLVGRLHYGFVRP